MLGDERTNQRCRGSLSRTKKVVAALGFRWLSEALKAVHDVDDTLFRSGKYVVDQLSSVSMTCPGLRVQPVVMPFGDPQSWTLVNQDSAVVEPVERFLAHLHAAERSPNTVKAYAHDLRDWFEFLDQRGVVWSRVRLEDVGRFVAWLRLPASARVGNVAALPAAESVCSEATVNRKLSAISAFYEFQQRHGVDLGDLLTTWQRRKAHGGSWRPLLAHLGSRPERARRIRLRAERRIPDTLDGSRSRRSWRLVIGCGIGSCFPCWLSPVYSPGVEPCAPAWFSEFVQLRS